MLLLVLAFLTFLLCPSLAFAHPGHGNDAAPMAPGSAVVLVGVTLGLAVHAWNTWGKRRLAPEPGHVGSSQPDTAPEYVWEIVK